MYDTSIYNNLTPREKAGVYDDRNIPNMTIKNWTTAPKM